MYGLVVDICHRGNVVTSFSNCRIIVKHSIVENEQNIYLLKPMDKRNEGNDKAKQYDFGYQYKYYGLQQEKIQPPKGFQQTLREYSRVVFFQVQTHDVTC